MGELLAFHQKKFTSAERREPSAAGAEIILFPGVRYSRMEEPLQPLQPVKRSPRRREKTKKEKAS
jgi:hypothetical protein